MSSDTAPRRELGPVNAAIVAIPTPTAARALHRLSVASNSERYRETRMPT